MDTEKTEGTSAWDWDLERKKKHGDYMRQAHALVKVMREVEQKKGRGIEDLTLGKMIDILGRLKAGKDSPIVFFPTCTENPEIKVERSIDPDGEVREEVIIR